MYFSTTFQQGVDLKPTICETPTSCTLQRALHCIRSKHGCPLNLI